MEAQNNACALACLILADDGVAITADKIKAIVQAAGIKDVPPFLPGLFANAFSNKDPKDILMSFSAPSAGAAPAAAAPSGGAGGNAAPAKAEEKKKEKPPPSESDDDMGLDLFG